MKRGQKSLPYRNAIVTGASFGLGEGLTRALVARGVRTVGIARSADALAALQAELGERFVPCCLSVDDTDALVAKLRELDRELGGIDLVIANAGVGAAREHPAFSYEATRDALHTNFCAAAATLTALTGAMAARRRGQLVAISSLSSFAALPSALAYSAPKAGLNMVCDCLRIDLAPHDIAVTNVYLGFVATRMVAASTHPMPQLMPVDEVVAQIVERLPSRPATITLPKLLGAGTRLLATLPESVRRGLFALAPKRWS